MLTIDANLLDCVEVLRLRQALMQRFQVSDEAAIGYLFRVVLLFDSAGKEPFFTARDVDWVLSYGERPGIADAFVDAGVLTSVDGKLVLAAVHPWRRPLSNPYGPNWGAVKKAALQRDGHACRKCESRQRLNVHHIKKLLSFGGDTEAANQLRNLITLCSSCHKDAHRSLREGVDAK